MRYDPLQRIMINLQASLKSNVKLTYYLLIFVPIICWTKGSRYCSSMYLIFVLLCRVNVLKSYSEYIKEYDWKSTLWHEKCHLIMGALWHSVFDEFNVVHDLEESIHCVAMFCGSYNIIIETRKHPPIFKGIHNCHQTSQIQKCELDVHLIWFWTDSQS